MYGSKDMTPRVHSQLITAGLLLLLTCAAFAIHGYHLGIEDEAIYLPAIKKLLNPALYPHDADFFMGQARGTVLPLLVASSVGLTHVPLHWAVFVWQFAAIFLLLLGCYCIARRCFADPRDQWGAVALVTTLLTLPVSATSIYLADQHLHPRTLSTAAILFAIVAALDRRKAGSVAWSAVAFVIHPLMAVFGMSLVVLLYLPLERWTSLALAAVPAPFLLRPTSAWCEAIATRQYYFVRTWEWYAWLGIFAPVAILWWFRRVAKRIGSPKLRILTHQLIAFSVLQFAAALIITVPRRMEFLVPLQPMRYLHLVYLLTTVFAGGLLAHYALCDHAWRWVLLLMLISAGMFLAQRDLFPTSRHIDWPGAAPKNKWVEAFVWVRQNTPLDAYFALDPNYMARPGEENYGFRALAERSQLADYSKDAAVVTVSPKLGPAWQRQVHALDGFQNFTADDFRRLREWLGVNWVILEQPRASSASQAGLDCPYRNGSVSVCLISE